MAEDIVKALNLVRDCVEGYRKTDDQLRLEGCHVFFKRLIIDIDDVVHTELTAFGIALRRPGWRCGGLPGEV